MAESETMIGGTCGGGEVGGSGAKAMVGGSLPPRKRLLAGLKQNNGVWPATATSSQSSPSSTPEIIHGPEDEGASEEAGIAETNPSSTEAKGSCMSCGALKCNNSSRRVKRNGAVLRVCISCALSLNKNTTSCLHCQATCPDVRDPSIWMQCHKCQRVLHIECEKKSSLLSSRLDSDSSVCSECRTVKIENDVGTPLLGTDSCLGSGNCASSAATEPLSPRNKKARVPKEPRSESSRKVAGDADHVVERKAHDSNKAVGERRRPTSQEMAVAAAEELAAIAGMAAAKAKATAVVKAAAAIKAAAVAKAALDAAALAARADAQVRAELCRNAWLLDAAAGGRSQHGAEALVETRKERAEKQHDVKIKGEEIPAANTQSPIGDSIRMSSKDSKFRVLL